MELKRKNEIRAAMKARRKALTAEERAAASEIICAKLAADTDISLRVDPFDGWYDRLLVNAPKGALKLGIAHAFQVVDDLPSEPHDVPLAGVVDDSLEHGLVEFSMRDDGFSAHVGTGYRDVLSKRLCRPGRMRDKDRPSL